MITYDDSQQHPTATANFVWLVILALAGLGGSLVISCVTPLVALGVALAGTVRLALALRAITAIWLTNQAIGFVFLNFPRTSVSILWGVALGAAVMLSTVVASTVLKRAASLSTVARLALALLFGFVAHEVSLFPVGLFLGGLETFAPLIVAQIGLVNLVWLAGLVALNELVSIVCKPWLGLTPRLAKAA